MPLQNGNSIKNFQNLPPQGPYFSAAKIAKHYRLQRQTAFVEYAFPVSLCRASFLPAGTFCGGFRAKKTGGFALLTQYDQLFHGQKTDKSRTETLKNVLRRQRLILKKDRRGPLHFEVAPPVFFVNTEKNIIRCIEKRIKKLLHFCHALAQEKTRSFQTGSWWGVVPKKIFWETG